MKSVSSPEELLSKLKPPLSLDVMRSYFKYFKSKKQSTEAERIEYKRDLEEFSSSNRNHGGILWTDNDSFAFAQLSEHFQKKLN